MDNLYESEDRILLSKDNSSWNLYAPCLQNSICLKVSPSQSLTIYLSFDLCFLISHKLMPFVKVRLFPGVAIGEPGHCQPHLLQRGEGYFWAAAQAHPSANLQAHPPLLQLAWHCQGPRSMPVCAQACLPCKYLS